MARYVDGFVLPAKKMAAYGRPVRLRAHELSRGKTAIRVRFQARDEWARAAFSDRPGA